MQIKCKSIDVDAKLPTKKDGDIGWDIYCVPDENWHKVYGLNKEELYFELSPGKSHVFRTGISMEIPDGYAGLLWDRSGLSAKFGVHRLAGVIDSSYRGEIMVCLINLGESTVTISKHDRIIQMIIQEEIKCQIEWAEELTTSEREAQGFGSSGR